MGLMGQVIIAVALCAAFCESVRKRGATNNQISSTSVAIVRFGGGKLTVFEDSVKKGKYYVHPLCRLIHTSAQSMYDIFAKSYILTFTVQIWSTAAQKAVYEQLIKDGIDVKLHNVQMFPIEEMRLVDKDRVMKDYTLPENWLSASDRPDEVHFQIRCADKFSCSQLEKGMKENPKDFKVLQVQFRMLSEKTASRILTVTGSDLSKGKMWTELENMEGANGDDRYLTSNDMQQMSAESVSVATASVRTDSDYACNEQDSIGLSVALQNILQQNSENTAKFDATKWDSVYWKDDWSRPDKITDELNNIYSLDSEHKDTLKVNEQTVSAYVGVGGGFDAGELGLHASVETGGSVSFKNKVHDISDALNENDVNSYWNGEKFVTKPMDLYRINLNEYTSTSSIAATSVQVRKVSSEYPIDLTIIEDTEEDEDEPSVMTVSTLREVINKEIEELKVEIAQIMSTLADTNEENVKEVDESVKFLYNATNWPHGSYCIFQQPKKRSLENGFSNAGACPEEFKIAVGSFEVQGDPKSADANFNHISFEKGGKKTKQISIRTCCKKDD